MPRETARELAIADSTETAVYQDQKQIVRTLGSHVVEAYMLQGDGAGGAGVTFTGVPFEPAKLEVMNEAGATATHSIYFYPDGGTAIGVDVAAAVADGTANAPTITRVVAASGAVTWTIVVPTAVAPDGETVTVLATGFRAVASSL